MLRQKISGLLKRIRNLKRLGMYTAVVLLIFALIIPIIGREDNTVQTLPEQEPTAPAALEEPAPPPENNADKTAMSQDIEPTTAPPQETESEAALPQETEPKTAPAGADIKNIIWPLKGDILQETGIVYSKTFSDYRYHNGIDLKAPRGEEVNAVLPGKVLSLETSRSEGKKVVIDHGSGWQGVYSHLEEVYVKPSSTVKAGQAIGHIGQPGLSEILEGPHLHFTLLQGSKVINPLDYLPIN